jgi:phosphoribosylanthranilate isomerase
MDLAAVSLTGADDTVAPRDLQILSERFPLVEWAILSTEKRQGTHRYPSEDWVAQFHKACPTVRKAIHLCGRDVDLFLAMDARILDKVARFDRVQLNFNQRRQPKDLDALVRVANQVSPSIILQHNSANAELWSLLQGRIPKLAMLFDASGGNGHSPNGGWPEMLPGAVCGFAGGLGLDNIAAEFKAIAAIAAGRRFWVDMESKLRSLLDDSFDLAACEAVLTLIHPSRGTPSGA